MSVMINATLPRAEEFMALRNQTGWGEIDLETAKMAISGSLGGVSAYENDSLIGMARLIGDGSLNLYIQDVIVLPGFRRQGIARDMLRALITDMQRQFPNSCTIGLLSVAGLEGLYAAFGFNVRPDGPFGAGMHANLGALDC